MTTLLLRYSYQAVIKIKRKNHYDIQILLAIFNKWAAK